MAKKSPRIRLTFTPQFKKDAVALVERGLLFPSFVTGREAMLKETRRLLDRVAKQAGWRAGEIRHRIFRHTYAPGPRRSTVGHR
jgi:hypothetical protein